MQSCQARHSSRSPSELLRPRAYRPRPARCTAPIRLHNVSTLDFILQRARLRPGYCLVYMQLHCLALTLKQGGPTAALTASACMKGVFKFQRASERKLTLGPQSRVQPSLMGISTTVTFSSFLKALRALAAASPGLAIMKRGSNWEMARATLAYACSSRAPLQAKGWLQGFAHPARHST